MKNEKAVGSVYNETSGSGAERGTHSDVPFLGIELYIDQNLTPRDRAKNVNAKLRCDRKQYPVTNDIH